jgi:hypothetical protein
LGNAYDGECRRTPTTVGSVRSVNRIFEGGPRARDEVRGTLGILAEEFGIAEEDANEPEEDDN